MENHPFQWHVVTNSNSTDETYPYICFSRLRGFDKVHLPNLDDAIARRNDLNNIEQWHKHWLPIAVEKYQSEAYSEDFLSALRPTE